VAKLSFAIFFLLRFETQRLPTLFDHRETAMLRLVPRAVFMIQSEKRTIGDDQQNGEQYMNFWIVVMATLLMNAFRAKSFSLQSRPIINLMHSNVQLRKVVGFSTLRKGGYTVVDEVRLIF
jgi:hypothetical protein